MVAINDFAFSETTPQASPSPPVTSHLKNSLHSLNTPAIILSAAILGLLVALMFAFVLYKARRAYTSPVSNDGTGRSYFVLQAKPDSDIKHSKLKPLKLLCPKTQFALEEKCAIRTNANEFSSFGQEIQESCITQNCAYHLPTQPPGLHYFNRAHSSRQFNAKNPPCISLVRRPNPATPALNPSLPSPAYVSDDIPPLCSPPSISPKEICEWIQSNSLLSAHDGYTRAREDSRLFTVSFQETGSMFLQQAHVSSMFSSSTLNRNGPRDQSFSLATRSPLCDHLVTTNLQNQKSKGATRVSRIEHLLHGEYYLGPLEQGTRWGSVMYTLDKPYFKHKDVQDSQKKARKGGKENRSPIIVPAGKSSL
ncbi:hypothetical protein J3R30DRAFT_3709348 [Lentinula aciculospora]|uniref:Uncharacterized protein n=1 Tax=Lentinula aciculospora TaxID=153920 RepID=A0A9W9A142_9AGAR|nr:hypothetical protein J3R30DRAFT_3709348 [Lentinula aciculospora]